MSQVHSGHTGHMPSSGRGMVISAWLTGIYFAIELGIGFWTGSIAAISDAFHAFSAVGGVLVAIVAAKLAHRPADEDRSFGWYLPRSSERSSMATSCWAWR